MNIRSRARLRLILADVLLPLCDEADETDLNGAVDAVENRWLPWHEWDTGITQDRDAMASEPVTGL